MGPNPLMHPKTNGVKPLMPPWDKWGQIPIPLRDKWSQILSFHPMALPLSKSTKRHAQNVLILHIFDHLVKRQQQNSAVAPDMGVGVSPPQNVA